MTKLESEGSRQVSCSWRTGLVIVLFLGCLISLSESLLFVFAGASKEGVSLHILASVLPKVIMIMVAYSFLWFFLVFPVVRIFRFDREALNVSLGIIMILVYALWSLHIIIDRYEDISWFSQSVYIVAVIFGIILAAGLLFSWLIYSGVKVILASKWRIVVIGICLAIPLLLAETIVALYTHSFIGVLPAPSGLLRGMISLPAFAVNIGCVICMVITLAVFLCIRNGRMLAKVFGAFTLFIFLGSILVLVFSTTQLKVSEGNVTSGHPVKNVILIVIDTLRADALSCYGGERISTPNIDELAKEGILFKKAYSAAPWTKPSVVSIMTGLTPLAHTARYKESVMPDNLSTLAEYMRDAGYLTHGLGANPVLTARHFQQGFMGYDFFPKQSDCFPCGKILSKLFPEKFGGLASTSFLTQLAMDWVESNADKDFFMWLHYFDPHVPYAPPEKYLAGMEPVEGMQRFFDNPDDVRRGALTFTHEQREWLRTLYHAEVHYVDDNIGLLVNHLKKLNIYDDTIIVLTSDHGEEFWEHGGYEHGHTLYDEVLWVPLMIKLAGSSFKGEIEESVSTVSIMSTVLELCRIEYQQDHVQRGSLAPVWESRLKASDMGPILSTGMLFYEEKESVRFDGQKYIRFLETDHEEYYDLTDDPGEKFNIAYTSEAQVQEAEEHLEEHYRAAEILRKHYSLGEGAQEELDADMTEKLRTLGYLN